MSTFSRPTLTYSDYTVGWICALPIELNAAQGLIDGRPHPPLDQLHHDDNVYTLGRIGDHNVAITCLQEGYYGTISAAVAVQQMRATFPALRFSLMVGIGGGVPSAHNDIRLGDVVVSRPKGTNGGVVQYDFGKTVKDGKFQLTGSLNKPPAVLLHAMSHVIATQMGDRRLPKYLAHLMQRSQDFDHSMEYPGIKFDVLYHQDYEHPGGQATCDTDHDSSRMVHRQSRKSTTPKVHYGLIASGNQVMKDGRTREKLRKELDILCFEMEAAGLVNDIPCAVIRGICDYSDSHKHDRWQPYAAAAAASYAKELLCLVPQLQGPSTRVLRTRMPASKSYDY